MSNFICEHCGVNILENSSGHYYTECPHYPLEPNVKDVDDAKCYISVFLQQNFNIEPKTADKIAKGFYKEYLVNTPLGWKR